MRVQQNQQNTHPDAQRRLSPGDITALLQSAREGEAAALDALMGQVYQRLRDQARRQLRNERSMHTLTPTALVHEAYVSMFGDGEVDWHDRAHFFAYAAQAMRHILIDHARSRSARKRGGGVEPVDIDSAPEAEEDAMAPALVDLDRALQELAMLNPRAARVVEMRYFGGMSVAEVADVLDVAERTVMRDWELARALIHGALAPAEETL